MPIKKILDYTIKEYKKNTWFILIFSLMFIASILLLFLAPVPTYLSMGGAFLRLGTIYELTLTDVLLISVTYLFSLFIFAVALSDINLIIKSKRTLTKLPLDLVKQSFGYASKIFFIYLVATLLIFIVNIATFETSLHNILYPLLSFFIFMSIFFVPPAVVIDELGAIPAVIASIKTVCMKWRLVLFWAVAGFVLIFLSEVIAFAILPLEIAKYVIIALASLLILPLLTIFQTQVYMEKYPLSP